MEKTDERTDAGRPPYRSPPCEECAAREEGAKSMQPFAKSSDRRCPECLSSDYKVWRSVCEGGTQFLLKKGYWLFGRRGRSTFTCAAASAPKHIHFECNYCSTRWEMLTATEDAG
jgi:hypothetical protein